MHSQNTVIVSLIFCCSIGLQNLGSWFNKCISWIFRVYVEFGIPISHAFSTIVINTHTTHTFTASSHDWIKWKATANQHRKGILVTFNPACLLAASCSTAPWKIFFIVYWIVCLSETLVVIITCQSDFKGIFMSYFRSLSMIFTHRVKSWGCSVACF